MLIKNCKCFDGERFLDGLKSIVINDGKISEITDSNSNKEEEIIDAGGDIVCPGYVDIHTHGIGGYDNSDITVDDIPKMTRLYNEAGCTTFIPSMPTIPSKKIKESLDAYRKFMPGIPGVHLEGPFINSEKRGAQNPVYIQKPNTGYFDREFGDLLDVVKRVTIAPEMDDGFALTRYLTDRGIIVSFGHTICGSDLAGEFFDLTDSIATHTFNAMPSIHHRSPSITTVALNRENVYCEIIPDLIHLHPEIIKLVFNIKGASKTITVSDSMLAAGLPYGEYDFSGLHVTVGDKGARLDSGNLAGSTITIADGIKNIIEAGISVEDALMSGTSSPAKAMGLENSCGYLKEGKIADIIILDHSHSVRQVIKDGKIIK